MVGLSRSEAAGRWSTTPAMAAPRDAGSSSAAEAPANAFVSPVQHDRWTCPLDPSSPGFVLARKLARRPIEDASCFTANFTSAASSAARRPRRASELQSQFHLVCRLLLEKKKKE